jgi:hypothetical protein
MHKDIITELVIRKNYIDFQALSPEKVLALYTPMPSNENQIVACFMYVITPFAGFGGSMPTITCQVGDVTAGTYDEFQVAQDVKTAGYKTLLGTWNNGAGGFICNYLFTDGIYAKMVCTGGVSLFNLVSGVVDFYFLIAQYDRP